MTQEPTAKQGCPGGQAIALAGDRLSDLPDDLLHNIMSFLPAPQLVQTSVLSRRWRDLWRSTPCINIDQRDFRITACSGRHEREKKWRKLENFTTNFLLFHNNVAPLDKFGYILTVLMLMHFFFETWIDGCDVASNTALKCSRFLSPVRAIPFFFLIWEQVLAASKGCIFTVCIWKTNLQSYSVLGALSWKIWS
jgi:hypothetical protein